MALRFDWLRRVSAGALAVILISFQIGVEPAHVCPVHDAIGGSTEYASQADHQSHDSHGAATAQESSESDHCCSCIGSCLVAAPALASAPVSLSWQTLESTASAALVREDARLNPLPRLLPFATAPPLS